MPETLHLKPAPDRTVIDPATGLPLPPGGDQVEDATYWHRRLAEGDVTQVQARREPTARAASNRTQPDAPTT